MLQQVKMFVLHVGRWLVSLGNSLNKVPCAGAQFPVFTGKCDVHVRVVVVTQAETVFLLGS